MSDDPYTRGAVPDPQHQPDPARPAPSQPAPSQPAPAQPERPQPAYGAYAPETAGGQPGAAPYGSYGSPYGPPSAPQPPDWSRAPSATGPVTAGTATGYAFSAFGRNAGNWLAVTLLVGAVSLVITLLTVPSLVSMFQMLSDPQLLNDPAAMQAAADDAARMTVLDHVLGLVGGTVLSIVGIVMYQGALVQTRDGKAPFASFFAVRNWGGVALLAVVQAVLSLVGLVPGVGWLLQILVGFFLLAAPFYVLDAGQDALTAVRSSVRLVSSNVGVAIVAILIVIALWAAGALLCGLGLFVVLPVSVLLGAYLYRRLEGHPVAG